LFSNLVHHANTAFPVGGDVIKDSAIFASRGSNIICRFENDPQLPSVNIDPNQIGQVINNLVLNAMEAMPNGGEVTLKASVSKNDPFIPANRRESLFVRVDVIDQGIGIPHNYLNRIFDPYFSTKKRGSGLGLATCYSIIQKHDGLIFAESETNKGTTVTFFLPATLEKPPAKIQTSTSMIRGTGNILIMDDEKEILEAVSCMLRAAGYQVTCATNGAEAVAAYQNAREQNPFDAVILDLTVPGGMGGMEAFTQIYAFDPKARVIVSSGYSTDPIMAEYKRHGFKAILAKPYGIHEVTSVLKQVLAS